LSIFKNIYLQSISYINSF